MPPVTVSVDATWRMNRVEFSAPHSPSGVVIGYGEILLEEPAEPSPGGNLLRQSSMGPRSVEQKTYGVLPATPVTRTLSDVMDETVLVEGINVTFAFAMEAMKAFMERWRSEDADKPAVTPMMATPEPASPTVQPPPQPPPQFTADAPPPPDFGGDIPPPPPPAEGEEMPAPPKPEPIPVVNPLPT